MRTITLDTALLKKASLCLTVLDNDTRWAMLTLLHEKGLMIVTDLHTHFNLPQPQASQHLTKLRNAGFVITARKGKYIYYSLNYENLEKVGGIIDGFLKENPPDYLQEYEEYVHAVITFFKPSPYEETYKGMLTWLNSYSQKLKNFTLAISEKKIGLLKRVKKEGRADVEKIKGALEKSKKEGVKAFISHYKP